MNTINMPQNAISTNTLVLNSLNDVVEVQLTEEFGPTLVDLNQVFGATDLKFSAAAEIAHVVDLSVMNQRGVLVLMAADECEFGGATRVVVRATTEDQDSTVIVFNVKVVKSAVAA